MKGVARRWGSFAPLALPVIAVLEIVLHFVWAARAPALDGYDVLEEPLRRLRQHGDAVVVTPRWAEPMVRRALGDEGLTLAALAGPGRGSAVEVSLFGSTSEELEGWIVQSEERIGSFSVRRYHDPHHTPAVVDFVDAFEGVAARPAVHLVPGAACMFNPLAQPVAGDLGGHPTWPRERYVCPGPPAVTAGVTVIADERWRPRRCVLAHPPAEGELAIRFSRVVLGRRLVGHGGLYWMTERARRGVPIQLRVEVDGAEVGVFIHADGDGWSPFEMDLGPPSAEPRDVVFFVSSPGQRDRDFCFEARSL